jgi:hypothetical protein
MIGPSSCARPGLGSGIDKDRLDYTVYSGQWDVGRIYQTRGGPDSLRWFWSMTVNGPMTIGRVATLEEAKAQFQKSWDDWKARANLEEIEWGLEQPDCVEIRARVHMLVRRGGLARSISHHQLCHDRRNQGGRRSGEDVKTSMLVRIHTSLFFLSV